MWPTVRLQVLHLPSLLDSFSELKLVSQLSSATHRRLAHTHTHVRIGVCLCVCDGRTASVQFVKEHLPHAQFGAL